MSNDTATWHDELIAKCVDLASTVLGERDAIMEIRRGEAVMGGTTPFITKFIWQR